MTISRTRQRIASIVAIAALPLWVLPACGASDVSTFVRVHAPRIALVHVNVVDGTAAPIKTDQTVIIDHDRIAAIGPASDILAPPDAQVLDLRGRTVLPGLVGMHDHLFYAADGGRKQVSLPRSFARLYLAAGVTTIRTAGTIDLQKDIAIKREIDEGREAGPKIHLSSPYMSTPPDIPTLERAVEQWANAGVTSLKAYTNLDGPALIAAIRTAHRRGLKVTGHLCAVGFREAAAMGIDNLEHGIIVDTEFYSRKIPDQCPDWGAAVGELTQMTVNSAAIQQTIQQLVMHDVAVTSTLAVFETFSDRTAFFDRRVVQLLTSGGWNDYMTEVQRRSSNPASYAGWTEALGLEMTFERSFVQAGGLLMAGADPTGWGGVLAGLADQRNIELLVEAGFTPEQAIQIASANGATFLGQSDHIGTVERAKQADLVVVRGNVVSRIGDIRNVEIVFKDGVGFDAQALTLSEHGNIGSATRWLPWTVAAIGPAIILLLMARQYVVRLRRKPEMQSKKH
jgi:imidazolonepropionase-like amidohydrolase